MSLNLFVRYGLPREVTPDPGPTYSLPSQSGVAHEPYLAWSVTTELYAGEPYDVRAYATFTRQGGGSTYRVPMYYDGSDTWRFRFTGPRTGSYDVLTDSTHAGLDALTSLAVIGANPNANAKGYLTNDGAWWAYLAGDNGTPRRAFYNAYQRHPHSTSPDGWETVGQISDVSGTRATQIETWLDELQAHGMQSMFMMIANNYTSYPSNYNTTRPPADDTPDATTFTILDDLLQRAYNRGMFVHFWCWADSEANSSSALLPGGTNGAVHQRLDYYLLGRLGGYPNWSMSLGYDLNEWVTPAEARVWHANLTGWDTRPRLFMARESQDGAAHITPFYMGTSKLDAYSQDNRPTSGFYADATARMTGVPLAYERRFLHTRDSVWSMTVTRRAMWQFTMAGGALGIYGTLWGPGADYPNPEQLKHLADFWTARIRHPLAVNEAPTDGVVLATAGNVLQVVYKENVSSIQVTIPSGQTGVPIVAVNATAATYAETSMGAFNAGTHAIALGSSSDWALAVGDFDIEPEPPPEGDKIQVSWTEVEIESPAAEGDSAQVSWTEVEIESPAAEGDSARVSWMEVEIEAPGAAPAFGDGYDLFGLEGNQAFDAANPTLKDGTALTGDALTYYNAALYWVMNSTDTEGTWSLVNIENRLGHGNVYTSGRMALNLQESMLALFRLTGDLRILDRLVDGWEAAKGPETIAWSGHDCAAIEALSGFWCSSKTGDPWSPYPKWLGYQSRAGTDLAQIDVFKHVPLLIEAAWVFHLNRGKTSPGGKGYSAAADYWLTRAEGYVKTWSEDAAGDWTSNYKGNAYPAWPEKRAAWGTYPVCAWNGGHTALDAVPTHRYLGLLGLHGGANIANPEDALTAAMELTARITDLTNEYAAVEVTDFASNPSITLRRTEWWSGTNNIAMASDYTSYIGWRHINLWLTGAYRHLADQQFLTRLARQYADMHYSAAELGASPSWNTPATRYNLNGDVNKGDILGIDPGTSEPYGNGERTVNQQAFNGFASMLVFEDGVKLRDHAILVQEKRAGGWNTPDSGLLAAALFIREALLLAGDLA